jgi:hypothetical protein
MNPSDPLSVAPIGIPRACLRMIRLGAAMAAAAALSGCASFLPDGGLSVAAGIAAQELEKDTIAIRTPEDATSARARVEDLLKRPFTADAAVQIALLNNRGLQAAYNELGLAETMMVQASLPPNPSFSFSRISGPLEYDIEAAIAADILAFATQPDRKLRPIDSGRRNLGLPRRHCASRRKHAGTIIGPLPRKSWSASLHKPMPQLRQRQRWPANSARPAR